MKTSVAIAVLVMSGQVVSGQVVADPHPERSQHPRNGLLAEVEFSVDSASLRWGANRKLGRVAAWAQANPDGVIVLEGRSDPRGSDAYNLELSVHRALTVRRELVEAGVPPSQLLIVGFGESGPPDVARRRVTIWATRNSLDVVLDRERALGALVIRSGEDDAAVVGAR